MKPAQSLHRHDKPCMQCFRSSADGIFTLDFFPRPLPQLGLRTATPAGVRLGVKAAIRRVVILRLTRRTHGKNRHRSAWPVIGDVAHDGEARPAVGAVDERIAVSPVRRLEEFPPTVCTDGNVRRDERANFVSGFAAHDAEAGIVTQRSFPHRDVGDARQRRRFCRKARNELFNSPGRPLHFDRHAGGGVADRPIQPANLRQSKHIRPEADSLHNARHIDLAPNLHGQSRTISSARYTTRSAARDFAATRRFSIQRIHSSRPWPAVHEICTISIPGCTRRAFSTAASTRNGT